MVYTVKRLADLAGVSVRTLHYYDELGLLQPRSHSASGYRHYGEEELVRLQQIMFFREMGFSLLEEERVKWQKVGMKAEDIAWIEEASKALEQQPIRLEFLEEALVA